MFEVSFVNSYSRPTPLRALVLIAFLYGGVAASCAFFQVRTSGQPTSQPVFILGVLTFAFGEVLNEPSLAFGSSPPAGLAHLCDAAPWLVWLGGLSPLPGRNFEFCRIRNDV
jgi:hypothetical protein